MKAAYKILLIIMFILLAGTIVSRTPEFYDYLHIPETYSSIPGENKCELHKTALETINNQPLSVCLDACSNNPDCGGVSNAYNPGPFWPERVCVLKSKTKCDLTKPSFRDGIFTFYEKQ